ncbi:MAG: hypothetical protein KC503_43030 [Myxococcales bacterium]|nr:hypothetical protein [Myxococcales bacterium]
MRWLCVAALMAAIVGCSAGVQKTKPKVYGAGEGVWYSPSGGKLCPMFSKQADCEKATKTNCIRRTTTENGGWPKCPAAKAAN